jgi:hypothetical protein
MFMAKSRSESPLREAKGNREMLGPGKNALPYFLALEGRGCKVRVKGQPEMRQA